MIGLEPVLDVAAVFFAAFALATLVDRHHPRRWINGAFYALIAVAFAGGSYLSDFANGVLALGIIAIGGSGRLGRGRPFTTSDAEREAGAVRHRSWLLLPALIVPAFAFLGTIVSEHMTLSGNSLFAPGAATLIWLTIGILSGLATAMFLFRPPAIAPVTEGRRLLDTVGWVLVLPQMLAALGAVFTAAGVGTAMGTVFTSYLPLSHPLAAMIAFGLGMAALTMVMGNAFAAFPVMMTALGLPLIVGRFGGDVIALSAIGMLSGFCGTLLTPMAANYNLLPVGLLELRDRYAVIRWQAPTAVLLLAGNIALMAFVVYP